MRHSPVNLTAVACLAGLTTSPAYADVWYSWSNADRSVAWLLRTNDFITSETTFTADQLLSCTPAPDYPPLEGWPAGAACTSLTFIPDTPYGDEIDLVWDDLSPMDMLFPDGSFESPGSYLSHKGEMFLHFGDGYLTVTEVPEPTAWAMILLGFGAIGYKIRRSRRVGVTHRPA